MNSKLKPHTMKISVFCASSPNPDKRYFKAAELLAAELVKHHVEVVYGGGAVGLPEQSTNFLIKKMQKNQKQIKYFK